MEWGRGMAAFILSLSKDENLGDVPTLTLPRRGMGFMGCWGRGMAAFILSWSQDECRGTPPP